MNILNIVRTTIKAHAYIELPINIHRLLIKYLETILSLKST